MGVILSGPPPSSYDTHRHHATQRESDATASFSGEKCEAISNHRASDPRIHPHPATRSRPATQDGREMDEGDTTRMTRNRLKSPERRIRSIDQKSKGVTRNQEIQMENQAS